MTRRWKIFVIVGVITAFADQITKILARGSLPTQTWNGREIGIPVPVIENFFDWRLSMNPGAAFGLFGGTGGARIFLSVIGLAALGAIVWMLYKSREDQLRLHLALGMVAGGAVGNLIDRIAFGVVTDFVVWKYYDTEWPTFNVADVALVVGVGLLFLDIGKGASEDASEGGKSATTGARKPGKRKSRKRRKR